MIENQNNPEKQYGGTDSFTPPKKKKWKGDAENMQQFLFRRPKCDDCCLSADDGLYVVFCFVTHPTSIVRQLASESLLAHLVQIRVLSLLKYRLTWARKSPKR